MTIYNVNQESGTYCYERPAPVPSTVSDTPWQELPPLCDDYVIELYKRLSTEDLFAEMADKGYLRCYLYMVWDETERVGSSGELAGVTYYLAAFVK